MKHRHSIILFGSLCCVAVCAAGLWAAPLEDDFEHRTLPPQRGGNDQSAHFGWELAKILIALGVVVAAVYLLLRLLRRFFPALAPAGGTAAPIKSLARFHLAPRQALHLVRCGNRLLVLGATTASINHIVTIDNPDEIDQVLQAIRRGESPLTGLARFFHRPSQPAAPVRQESPDLSDRIKDQQ